jgi:hypothetical protein
MIETMGLLSFGAVCGWNAVLVARLGRSIPKLILFVGLMASGALTIGHVYDERPGLALTATGLMAGMAAALALFSALGRRATTRQRDGIV